MNKQELLDYLKAVCDAENAIYACNEAQGNLNKELKNCEVATKIEEPVRPRMPVRKSVESPGVSKMPMKVGAVIGLIILILCFISDFDPQNVGAMLFVVLLPAIGALIGYFYSGGKSAADGREIQRRSEEQYERDMEKYREDVKQYEHRLEIRKQIIQQDSDVRADIANTLRKMLEQNAKTRERVCRSLEKLYASGIIYESFRKMAAVNTIYEYIAMGLCDGLEGPHGAYAQYMEDVRTERICDSINDLKKSILSALNKIISVQRQLVGQMQMVNRNLESISNDVGNIRTEIAKGYNAIMQSVDGMKGSIDNTNQNLAAIRAKGEEAKKFIQANSHNQYVALREQNIDAYLLKNPNFL